jgi:DNA-nicking Smr family endonuclease
MTYPSLGDLRSLLGTKILLLPDFSKIKREDEEGDRSPSSEKSIFEAAMVGVKPLSQRKGVARSLPIKTPEVKPAADTKEEEDAETLSKLTELVQRGTGFNLLDTAEYIEGTGYSIHPEVARHLHRGNYSIQAYVDLHALMVGDAREVFEKFLRWAVTTGKRGVLIIHGRGLSSAAGPVLKTKVIEWLTLGPWRKWVVAYSSARPCDGGAGATYVLLRPRPVSNRMKKGKRKTTWLPSGPWL